MQGMSDTQFLELVPRYCTWAHLSRSPLTAQSYKEGLGKFLAFAMLRDIQRPDQVTLHVVEDYLLWLRQQGSGAATCNQRLAILRGFWRWMRRQGYADNSPAADVERMRTAKRLPKYLSIADQEKILAGVAVGEGDAGRRDEAIVATALLTGLRCSELVHLRLEHVDLAAGVLRVVSGKGDKDREVPLVPRVRRILRTYLHARLRLLEGQPSEWLFVSAGQCRTARGSGTPKHSPRRRGEQLCSKTVYHLIRRVCNATLGRKLSPHVMRHSFATRLREKGADLQLIQETLGHSDISTTTIYASLATDRRREMLRKLLA